MCLFLTKTSSSLTSDDVFDGRDDLSLGAEIVEQEPDGGGRVEGSHR